MSNLDHLKNCRILIYNSKGTGQTTLFEKAAENISNCLIVFGTENQYRASKALRGNCTTIDRLKHDIYTTKDKILLFDNAALLILFTDAISEIEILEKEKKDLVKQKEDLLRTFNLKNNTIEELNITANSYRDMYQVEKRKNKYLKTEKIALKVGLIIMTIAVIWLALS